VYSSRAFDCSNLKDICKIIINYPILLNLLNSFLGVCSWIAGQDPWHAEAQYSSEEVKLLPPLPLLNQSYPSFSNFRGVTIHPWAGAHPIPLLLCIRWGRRWRQSNGRFNQILISRAYFSYFVDFICIILFYFNFFCKGGKISLFLNVIKHIFMVVFFISLYE